MIVSLDVTLWDNKKHPLSNMLRLRIGDSEWADLFLWRWSGPVAIFFGLFILLQCFGFLLFVKTQKWMFVSKMFIMYFKNVHHIYKKFSVYLKRCSPYIRKCSSYTKKCYVFIKKNVHHVLKKVQAVFIKYWLYLRKIFSAYLKMFAI